MALFGELPTTVVPIRSLYDFQREGHKHPCKFCHEKGHAVPFHSPNNNAIGFICKRCGEKHPFVGVMWVKQGDPREHGQPRKAANTDAVWKEKGNFCWHCSITYDETEQRKVARQAHHVKPIADGGDENGITIPLCGPCHSDATERWREVRRLRISVAPSYTKD